MTPSSGSGQLTTAVSRLPSSPSTAVNLTGVMLPLLQANAPPSVAIQMVLLMTVSWLPTLASEKVVQSPAAGFAVGHVAVGSDSRPASAFGVGVATVRKMGVLVAVGRVVGVGDGVAEAAARVGATGG